eukprot:jgi/Psemu1/51181/gm1.51181_g
MDGCEQKTRLQSELQASTNKLNKPVAFHTQLLAYYSARFHHLVFPTRDLSADGLTKRRTSRFDSRPYQDYTFALPQAHLGARRSATRPTPPSLATSLWPPPPQVLLEHLLNLFEAEAVGALGIFVANSQGLPCLRLVHGLQKYPGPLAQHSPNKNKAFGYLDDIKGEAGELVLVDSAMLSPTIASRVLTLDHHLAELEAHPGRLPQGVLHPL